MDYTTISLADVRAELAAIAADGQAAFGGLSAQQLNWKPDASRWSVAQCLEHLVTANGQMADMADAALDGSRSRTLWQRLPVWPRLLGRMLDPDAESGRHAEVQGAEPGAAGGQRHRRRRSSAASSISSAS